MDNHGRSRGLVLNALKLECLFGICIEERGTAVGYIRQKRDSNPKFKMWAGQNIDSI